MPQGGSRQEKKRSDVVNGTWGPEGDREFSVLEDALKAQETRCTAGPREASLQAGCL